MILPVFASFLGATSAALKAVAPPPNRKSEAINAIMVGLEKTDKSFFMNDPLIARDGPGRAQRDSRRGGARTALVQSADDTAAVREASRRWQVRRGRRDGFKHEDAVTTDFADGHR